MRKLLVTLEIYVQIIRDFAERGMKRNKKICGLGKYLGHQPRTQNDTAGSWASSYTRFLAHVELILLLLPTFNLFIPNF